ncbi:hypothetical protein RPALISO_73 [Ruegeria phage RpAliso]|nr:hypothetical protein RPALISO_73 [Ruegeria phage RpAliso]
MTELAILPDTDMTELRRVLNGAYQGLHMAAMDYAESALGAANLALNHAKASSPMSAIYTPLQEHTKFARRALTMLEHANELTGIILASVETMEGDAEEFYGEHLEDAGNTDVVTALLEAANTRIGLVSHAMPDDATIAPAARLNGALFHKGVDYGAT